MKAWDWKHTLAAALFILASVAQYLASAQGAPIALVLHITAPVLGLASLIIALVSQSILGGPPSDPDDTKKLPRPGLSAMVLCLTLTGCAALFGGAAPVLDCTSAVLADAAKGMGVVQIVEDVGARCSLDAAAVIAIVAKSTDPTVTSSKAYAEAMRAKAALQGMP